MPNLNVCDVETVLDFNKVAKPPGFKHTSAQVDEIIKLFEHMEVSYFKPRRNASPEPNRKSSPTKVG